LAEQTSLEQAVERVLEENQQARAELIEAIDALSAERRQERWFGEWSLHEIIAHLYEWQNGFAHALERMARGERPEIPDYNPEESDDVYNALVTERNRGRSWEELMAALAGARQRHEGAVRNLVGRLPAERFEEGKTARRLANTAEHDREHIPAILEWRRANKI
jgi:hypothetical protein